MGSEHVYHVAYRHYHAPDGCTVAYGGAVPPHIKQLKAPRKCFADQTIWDTGRACGDWRLMGPEDHGADVCQPPDLARWYGRDGYYCRVPVYASSIEDAVRFIVEEFGVPSYKDRGWRRTIRELKRQSGYYPTQFIELFPREWQSFVASAIRRLR